MSCQQQIPVCKLYLILSYLIRFQDIIYNGNPNLISSGRYESHMYMQVDMEIPVAATLELYHGSISRNREIFAP